VADIVVTAASVLPIATPKTPTPGTGVIGEAGGVTQGQVIYKKSADGKWYLAKANGTAEQSGFGTSLGIAQGAGAVGQTIPIFSSGQYQLGGTLTPGLPLYLSAANPGGITDTFGDLGAGNYTTQLGVCVTAANALLNFNATGVTQ